MRFKLRRKISHRKNYVRYLGTKIDENSSWKFHVHDLTSKLNKLNIANAVLSKLRHFATCEIWRSVYFAIFHPLVSYVCIAWRLTRYLQHKVSIFQKKALNIMSFVPLEATTTPHHASYLYLVITQSDLGENQLSAQPLIHAIISNTN